MTESHDYTVEDNIGINKLMEDTEKRMMNKDIDTVVVGVVTKFHDKHLVVYTDMSLTVLLRKGFVYYLESSIFNDPHTVAFSASIIGPSNFITVGMTKEPPIKFVRSSEYEIICNEKVIINTIIKNKSEMGSISRDSFMSTMNIRR
jgi:hypothetical protein